MRPAPFISFLVTAYRTEHYVGETIQSVLAQTRPDWELIVVDNGNSDEMARIIGRLTSIRESSSYDRRTRATSAVSVQRRLWLGRYLRPLNSDDLCNPDFASVSAC